nr:LPS export ABC transporter permease LptF [uncultured Roseovarius sp.]
MLSQFMVLFGFFALVLVAIFWINKAVRMFDRLIADGQPAWVFLEFTALTLPGVIGIVLPIASFAGAVYVTNRLSTESELTVMQATGYSPYRLIRPVVVYGIIVALMMSILTHFLIPSSLSQLKQRRAEINQNITAKLLTPGEFLHPAPGITVYIRHITPLGELQDVFLSDRRSPEDPVTYTSNTAYLVPEGGSTKLVMVNGLSQTLNRLENRLFTTHFDDFSYDISSLVSGDSVTFNEVGFAKTANLLFHPEEVADRAGVRLGEVTYEAHNRIAQALMCIVAATVGFATLLLGTYSRFGVWWQVVVAFLLLVSIKLIEGAVSGPVLKYADLWPLMYVPVLVGTVLTAVLLRISANPGFSRWFRRRQSTGGAS